MNNLTENKIEKIIEQEEVLSSSGKNLIVSASAGSGKTTVMINKIIKLLVEEKISVDELLVLTYTKASASEMKQRLEKKLCENIEDDFYRQQLDKLPLADITTFHAFYQKLIKKNFYILNISPNFNVLDNSMMMNLRDIALTQSLKEFSENSQDYFEFFQMFGKGRNNKNIKQMIFDLSDFLSGIKDENWQEKSLNFFKTKTAENMVNESIVGNINYYIKNLKALQSKAYDYELYKYVENINKTLSQLESISTEKSLAENLNLLESYKVERLNSDPNDKIDFRERLSELKTALKSFVDDVMSNNYGDETVIQKSYAVCEKTIKTLFAIHKIFEEKYASIKSQKCVFDFNDLERYALLLLQNETVRKEIQDSYKYIFVDEFQDANELQESMLALLAKDNNRFMVGDVKQSIYAFRQSNPDIFLNIQQKYLGENESESKKLNSNFRSHNDILSFVDDIFSVIMTMQTAGIDYDKDARFVGRSGIKDDKLPRVEIDIINPSEKIKSEQSEVYSVKNQSEDDDEVSFAQREAQVVASHIVDLLGTQIYDRKKEKFRDVEYGDIAILLRTRGTYLSAFASKLASLGLPIRQNSNENLINTPEGQCVYNLLLLAQNEKQDLALTISLLSVFGGFDENELAKIRTEYVDSETFYDAVKNYKNEKSDILKQKLEEFFDRLGRFRFNVRYSGVLDALYSLYNEISLEEKLYKFIDGDKRHKLYVAFAEFFTNAMSLEEFLSIENIEIAMPNDIKEPSVIEITTIHSSKGLEYPIVFVCNLASDFNKQPKIQELVMSKNYQIATKFYDNENNQERNSIFYEAVKRANKKSAFAEKIRLLYVALTRAQNHLYLIGTTKLESIECIKDEWEIQFKRDYFSLILGSLNEKILNDVIIKKEYIDENNKLKINVVECENAQQQINESSQNIAIVEGEDIDELTRYISFVYPNFAQTKLAYKNSVSSIVSDTEYSSRNYAPQNLDLSEHLTDIAINDIGTCYHKILELLEFEKINSAIDVENEISKYIELKLLNQAEVQLISYQNIFENVKVLKQIISDSKIFKEQQFMMKVPHSTVVNSSVNQNILVQGVIDLFIEGKENILIDYKLTSLLSVQEIKKRYSKQIKLYKMALETALNKSVAHCFILNLKTSKLIEIN